MDIRQNTEDPIQVYDGLDFVTKQDVSPGETNVPVYQVRGPRNHVIAIEQETPLAPELRDSSGTPIDNSTQIVLQKADIQGNPLGNAIIFETNMGTFDYEKFRSDPQYFKYTEKPLLLKPREYLNVYVDIPSGANAVSASDSRLTIGDNVTQTGKPVFIRHLDSMSSEEKQMVQQA